MQFRFYQGVWESSFALSTCMIARMRPHWTGGQGFHAGSPAGSKLEALELSTCGPLKSELRS